MSTPQTADAAVPFSGDLTIHSAAAQREALLSLAGACEGPLLQLDLAQVGEFDCAGVQLLLSLRHSLAASGRGLCITAVSPVVGAALETCHIDAANLSARKVHP